MNFAETLRPTSENLWSAAIETLPEHLKSNINFAQSSKHKSLDELLEATSEARKRFIDKSWSFKRKSGEVVILRYVLAKAARWLDNFKQVGDILASIDPLHAAPPWAGVRFLLIVATGDLKAYSNLLEATIHIAEMIYRNALVEKLLSNSQSEIAAELRRALIKLYAAILTYLSEECAYYEENGFKRASKHGLFSSTKFEEAMTTINEGQKDVDRCINFFGLQSQLDCAAEVERRLKDSYDLIRHSDDRAIEYLEQQDKHRRVAILRWISEQPYEKHHVEANKEVLEGTGTWLLDEVVFIRWMNESASSILWLYGIPGSGKSKLTSVVIKNALQQFNRSQTSALGYFYCSRNPAEPGRSDAASIVASIARQLSTAEYEGPLLEAAIEMYEAKGKSGFASGSLQLEESMGLILKLLEKYQDATIVIDALDECNEETRGDLLDALEELLKESPCLLKVFVSSRTDQNIVYRLEAYPNLKLSSDRNSKDISLYARSETKRLIKRGDLMRRSQRKEELCDKIINELISKAGGMFRWVSLQLQTLCKLATDVAIDERLGRLPKTLADLYQDILNTINDQESDADRQFAQNALSWLLCAREQLKTEDFLAAVSVTRDGSGSPIEKGQLLQICSNLVVFDSTADTFRFAHLTVREFLEGQETYNLASAGALVAEACLLNLINMTPNTPPQAPFVEYSSLFWAEHVKTVTHESQRRLHDSLCKFLAEEHEQSCFYFWNRRVEECLDWKLQWRDISPKIKASISYVPRVLLVVCAYDLCGVLSLKRWEQLAQKRPRNLEAETHHTIAFRYGNGDIIKWQLSCQILPRLTEKALVDVASNEANGEKVMALLLDSGGTNIAITEEVVNAASRNEKSGKRIMALLLSRAPVKAYHITDGAAVLIIKHFGLATVEQLLGKITPELKITEDIIVAAAENNAHGEDVLRLLLKEHEERISVTERMVIAAAQNQQSGLGILDLLVKMMPGDELPVTEDAIRDVIHYNRYTCKTDWAVLVRLCSYFGGDFIMSEDVVLYILSRSSSDLGFGMMDSFLAALGSRIAITPIVIGGLLRYSEVYTLEAFLKTTGTTIQITKDIFIAAGGNKYSVDKVLELTLRYGTIDHPVTEDIVTTLLQISTPKVFRMFLLISKVELHITEELVEATAENRYFSDKLIELLLRDWGFDFPTTESAVKAFLPRTLCSHMNLWEECLSCGAAGSNALALLIKHNKAKASMTEGAIKCILESTNKGLVEQLIEKWGDEVMLTWQLLDAATKNHRRKPEFVSLMALLLQRCAVPITDIKDVLSKALQYCNEYTLRKFLKRTGVTIQTNEKVVNAVSRNLYAEEVLVLLLNDHEIESPITEGLIISICRHFSARILLLFLDRVGIEIQVTEDVAVAIAGNSKYGEGILAMIQRHGRMAIAITDKVIEAAARWNNAIVMKQFLDMWDEGVMATDDMIQAVSEGHGNGNDTTTILPNGQSAGALITDAVIHATTNNYKHRCELLLLLLETEDATFSIRESLMKTAAHVLSLAEFQQLLVNRNNGAVITEGLVESVVSGCISTTEKLALLFDESGGRVPITEGMIKKAIENRNIDAKSLDLLLDKDCIKISITKRLVEEALEYGHIIYERIERFYTAAGLFVETGMIKEVDKLQLLLEKGGSQIPITEKVIKTAIRSGSYGKLFLKMILRRGWADVTITQASFEQAALSAPKDNELTKMLLHFQYVHQEGLSQAKDILKKFPWPTNCRKKFNSPQRNVRNKRRRAAKYRKGTRSWHRKMLRAKERDSKAQARSVLMWGNPWRNQLLSCIIFVILCLALGYLPWFSF